MDVQDEAKTKALLLAELYELRQRVAQLEDDCSKAERIEEALRDSEERFRTLFDSMTQGFALHEIVTDEDGRPVDYRFLNVNPAFERLTGLRHSDLLDKCVLEVLPGTEPYWIENYGRVALTGEPACFENYSADLGRWYEAFAYRPAPRQFAVIFTDITERKRAEEVLRRREEEFRALVENAPDVISVFDRTLRRIYVNSRIRENTGLDASFMNGKSLTEAGYPDNFVQSLNAALQNVFATGLEETVELDYEAPKGRIWLQIRCAPIRALDGSVERVMSVGRDITERKQAEQALEQSEERFRKLFEDSPIGIALLGKEREYLLTNRCFQDFVGYSEAEVSERGPVGLMHPDDWEPSMALSTRLRSGEIPLFHLEQRYIRKDGAIVWADTRIVVFRDSEGQLLHTIAWVRDITERKRAEDALRESEEKYRQLFKAESDALFLVELETLKFLDVNPAAEKLYGYSRDELLGLRSPDISSEQEKTYQAISSEAEHVSIRMHRKRDGSVFPVEIAGTYFDVDGKRVHLAAVRDISFRVQAEELLRESEGRLHSLVNALPDLVWLKDLNGVYLACNARFESFFGARQKDIVGKNDYDFMSEELADFFRSYDKAALEKGGPNINEEEITFAEDGHREILETVKTPMYSNDGRALGVLGIGRDITNRKRAEQELADSELRFRSAVDQAADAFFLIDEHQHFVDVNQAACTSLGYTCQELLSMSLYEVDPNTEPDNHTKNIWDKLGSGQKILFQTTHRRKNGSLFPVEVSTSQLELGGQKLIQCFARDISERNAAEAKLLESSERINALFGATTDSVILLDSDCIILAINQTGANRRDRYPQDLIGRSLCETLPGPCAEVRMAKIQDIVRTGQPAVLEEERDGLRYSISMFPVFDKDGEVSQVASFSRDITELMRGEKEREKLQAQLNQAQKLESVGRLAGGIAHDFNNMLGVILGHADLALDDIDPTQQAYADTQEIIKAAQRSADLVRQLLAFARKQTISPKVLDINETVQSMIKMVRRLIGEDIELLWKPGLDLWPVKIDPTQIDQILANLCVNARDAIAGVGNVIIETSNATVDGAYCRMHPGASPGEYVVIAVSDDGCGMAKEVMDKLFEPFFTTKEVGKGTGLGLATVYGIVKQNNGFIDAKSVEDQGTTFRVYLPKADIPAPEVQSPQQTNKGYRGNETILLVEDEEAILGLVIRALERRGYQVLAARNPAEALSLAKGFSGQIHLLITDVVMPGMNGKELAERLEKFKAGFRTIFMSGYTRDVITQHGVLDEGLDFLQKPFAVKALTEKVRDVLDA